MGPMIRELPPAALPEWEHFGELPDLEKSRLGPASPWLSTGKLCTFSVEEEGRPLARVTAMVNPGLQDQAVPTGLLGCFAFRDEAFDRYREAMRPLMVRALGWLRAQGMARARAPMNFTTWYSYRAETWSGDYPRFPGEDVLDPRYAAFLAESMQPMGTYASHLIDDHQHAQAIARELGIDRAGKVAGITVEELTREKAMGDLRAVFDLASKIFPQDYSYGPIGFGEFQELYAPLIQRLPEFYALVARGSAGEPVGLAYGYRHPCAAVKTGILKTVGVLPEYRRGLSRGISWFLTYQYHMNLIANGYQHFIHATMKEDNTSRAMSNRFAHKIREYSLYEAQL